MTPRRGLEPSVRPKHIKCQEAAENEYEKRYHKICLECEVKCLIEEEKDEAMKELHGRDEGRITLRYIAMLQRNHKSVKKRVKEAECFSQGMAAAEKVLIQKEGVANQRGKNRLGRQAYHHLEEVAKAIKKAFTKSTSARHFVDFWGASYDIARQEKVLKTTMEQIETILKDLEAKAIHIKRGDVETDVMWKARVLKTAKVNRYKVQTGVALVPAPHRGCASAFGVHTPAGGGAGQGASSSGADMTEENDLEGWVTVGKGPGWTEYDG